MAYGGIDIESTLRTIFRRCVDCPPGTPSCPVCPEGESCTLQARSCSACVSTVCIKTDVLPGQAAQSSSVPTGAIVGGVFGGVVVILGVAFLIWYFWIRNRRKAWHEQIVTDQALEKRDQSALHRDARQSTRSAHSVASTVLTRASNVIQIAYIPGVTNRSPPDSPNTPIPPVPPIPIATTNQSVPSTPQFEQDRHFFLLGDLRDSSYSDLSDRDRQSISPSLLRASVATDRQSISPSLLRASVATNATVPTLPAQQAVRGRPAVVSVHVGSSSPLQAPPVPQIPKDIATSTSSIVARSLVARPIQVKKSGSAQKVPTMANLIANQAATASKQATSQAAHPDSLAEPEVKPSSRPSHEGSVSSLVPGTSFPAVSLMSPDEGGREGGTSHHPAKTDGSGLTLMIEEAVNRAARDVSTAVKGSPLKHATRDSGPFSDANEVKENL